MRFFSNEGKESSDQPSTVAAVPADEDHPERVQSGPVAVPPQRSGSPWSNAPGDSPAKPDGYAGDHRGDVDAHDHGPKADDVDLPLDGTPATDERRDQTAADQADDVQADDVQADDVQADDVQGDDEARDGVLDGGPRDDQTVTTMSYHPDGTVTTVEDGPDVVTGDGTPFGEGRGDEADRGGSDTVPGEGTTFGDAPAEETDRELTEDVPATDHEDTVIKDEGGFDDPKAVDPVTDEPLAATSTDAASDPVASPSAADAATDSPSAADAADGPSAADAADATDGPSAADGPSTAGATDGPAAMPTGDRLPGSVAEPDLSRIFDQGDAAGFKERWRDVQLRFVDSPKDATAEAAGLLDEAVEKLASSLRAQKSSLAGTDSADTEQLRIELRGYRELLNKVLGL